MRPKRICCFLVLSLLFGTAAASGAPNPITVREPGTNLFADSKKIEHVVAVQAAAGFKGRLTWAFAASNGQVFPGGRGEAPLAGKGAEAVVKFSLATPAVKSGVVLEAQLELTLFGNDAAKPEATLVRKVHIFPADPFALETKWLKELGLVLFDTAEKSKTAEAFEALKIPFELVKDIDRLVDRKEGVIVVGEGISFREERGLCDALAQLAAKGCKVICMAATDGNISVPGIGGGENATEALSLRRRAVIHQFDKRLDAEFWSSKGPLASRSLSFGPEEGKVFAEIKADAAGWPWADVEASGGGRLIFCQFDLVRHWDSSPTPRYLFARILETVSPQKENVEPK